mgnify:CR=1 FL=1
MRRLTLPEGVEIVVIEHCLLKDNHELVYTVDKLRHLYCSSVRVVVGLGYVLDELALD